MLNWRRTAQKSCKIGLVPLLVAKNIDATDDWELEIVSSLEGASRQEFGAKPIVGDSRETKSGDWSGIPMAFGSPVLNVDERDGLRRFFNPQDRNWYVQLMQGDSYVSGDRNEVLTTILGSCVAACIRDPVAGVGGMNHFLLPEGRSNGKNGGHFGFAAMEELIDRLRRLGAQISRMEAKLFGGAKVLAPLSDVGASNADFAQRYLATKGVKLVGGDVGGFAPRRIQYWPVTGRVRQLAVRSSKGQNGALDLVETGRAVAESTYF